MKIIAISDTHCSLGELINNLKIPDGDILIHAGDLTYDGSLKQISTQLCFLGSLPHSKKILISGNHDFGFEETPDIFRDICKDNNIIYLENESIELDGLNFFGSPITPRFFDWAFNVDRGENIKKYWDAIPDNTDVLITHGPPYGIGDLCRNGHVGCKDLLDRIRSLKIKLHIFGHIHEGQGVYDSLRTKFVNASIMNGFYYPVYEPIVIDL